MTSSSRPRDSVILWLPVAFGGGIACYFALPFEPSVWGPRVLSVVLAGVSACFFMASKHRLTLALVLVTAFVSGMAMIQYRTQSVAAPVIDKRLGPVWVEGLVGDIEVRPRAMRLTLESLSIDTVDPQHTPQNIRVTVRQAMDQPLAGQAIRLLAVLYPPPPPAFPGGFDFQRHAYFERLGAVGYSVSHPDLIEADLIEGYAPIHEGAAFLANLRQAMATRIQSVLPGETGAIATALLTGRRGAIGEDTWWEMRHAGLAHLLAISGLHMGMIAAFVFWFSRALFACSGFLTLHFPIKKWAAVCALLACLVYLVISGASTPTQRAFIMTGIVLLGVLVDRLGISMRLACLAALLVLILTPESLLNPGFQMSFAAVFALVAFYSTWRERSRERVSQRWSKKVWGYVGGVALTTIIATVATAPFSLYHFNHLALYGVVANLVGVPLTALWVMPSGFLSMLLMPLGLETLFLQVMSGGIRLILDIAGAVSRLPGASLQASGPTSWGLGMIALGGLWLCLRRDTRRWFGLVPVALGFLSAALVSPPHILVDGGGRLIAVRLGDGGLDTETGDTWAFSSKRTARRVREEWMRRTGGETAISWSQHQNSDAPAGTARLRCDSLACLYEAEGVRTSLIVNPDALAEDCAHTDLVVSLVPVGKTCMGPEHIIDRFDLWREGTHAIWLTGGEADIVSLAQTRGRRPWVIRK